ncbi:MAG: LysM peptidoglycan-binding domain-containing protein [Anaerolineae bacterium]
MSIRWIWVVLVGIMYLLPLTITAQERTQETDVPNGLTIHVVQRGENLFRIALAYNTTVSELVERNGLSDATRIFVGQRLLVPDNTQTPLPQTHIVQPGETLSTIASLYQISVDVLVEQNEISNTNAIYAGQVLTITSTSDVPTAENIIPTEAPTVAEVTANDLPMISGNIHVVQSGETLFRIAVGYGLTTQELAQANGIIDPTVIYSGQQLIIPNLPESQLTTADLPAPIRALTVEPLILVEGETGVIRLTTAPSTTVSGTFLGRDLAFITQDNNNVHVAFVGIPVFTEGGIYTVDLNLMSADGTQTQFAFNVRVAGGAYGTQNLNVTDANLTAPAVQENELNLLTNLTRAITLTRRWEGPFSIPAAAAMNAPFGTARSYNGGEISAYHSGADFASAPGTPIYAAAGGVVVLADALNIRGNTIVIDHGWGIYTAYAHQTTLNVTLGDEVVTGQMIGTAGSTGRVTGPHLHWEIWVNGVPVNPLTWTQQIFP